MNKSNGVFPKRGEGHRIVYFWRIGREKSKDYISQTQCAMDFVTKYIEQNPKYTELVYDKTWDEIFHLFGIKIHETL